MCKCLLSQNEGRSLSPQSTSAAALLHAADGAEGDDLGRLKHPNLSSDSMHAPCPWAPTSACAHIHHTQFRNNGNVS